MVFFLKCRYYGKPLFGSGLKEILKIDKMLYFVDKINHAWVFLHTSSPTRASTVISEIEKFNGTKLSEQNRIILEKARAEDDPLVLTMSAVDGKVTEKHWFYQYIDSKRDDPSFVEWISESLMEKKNKGSAASGGVSNKLDKTLKQLAIEMTEKVGGVQEVAAMTTRSASARCGGGGAAVAEGGDGGYPGSPPPKRACASAPKNYREPSESGDTIAEDNSQPLSHGGVEEGVMEAGWEGQEEEEAAGGGGVVDFAAVAAAGEGGVGRSARMPFRPYWDREGVTGQKRAKAVARRLTAEELRFEQRKRSVAEGLVSLATAVVGAPDMYMSEAEREDEETRMTEERAAQALEQARRLAQRRHRAEEGLTRARRSRLEGMQEFREMAVQEWRRVEEERGRVEEERKGVEEERRRVEEERKGVEEDRRRVAEERRVGAEEVAEEKRKVEAARRAMMSEQVQEAMARASAAAAASSSSSSSAPSGGDDGADGGSASGAAAVVVASGPMWVDAADLARVSEERDQLGEELETARRELVQREREAWMLEKQVELLQLMLDGKDNVLVEKDARIAEKDARLAEKDALIAERGAVLEERGRALEILRRESLDKYNFALNQLVDAKEMVARMQALVERLTFGRGEGGAAAP